MFFMHLSNTVIPHSSSFFLLDGAKIPHSFEPSPLDSTMQKIAIVMLTSNTWEITRLINFSADNCILTFACLIASKFPNQIAVLSLDVYWCAAFNFSRPIGVQVVRSCKRFALTRKFSFAREKVMHLYDPW